MYFPTKCFLEDATIHPIPFFLFSLILGGRWKIRDLLWNPHFVSHLNSSFAAATQRTNHHDPRKYLRNTCQQTRPNEVSQVNQVQQRNIQVMYLTTRNFCNFKLSCFFLCDFFFYKCRQNRKLHGYLTWLLEELFNKFSD